VTIAYLASYGRSRSTNHSEWPEREDFGRVTVPTQLAGAAIAAEIFERMRSFPIAEYILMVAVAAYPQAVADIAIRPQGAQSGILVLEYEVRLCRQFGWDG
jgi:hypothetical protein